MSNYLSRREALKNLAIAAGAVAVPALRPARAAELPHLSPQDQMAQQLSYHENAKTVKVADFPMYTPNQKCSTCLQIKGPEGAPWQPCTFFANKLVNANGWCKVWSKRP